MSEHWDFYTCQIEDASGSIFLNMGIMNEERPTHLSKLLSLQYPMQHPREDGLSSAEDAESLYALEDEIEAQLYGIEHVYVGRLTHGGLRCFFVYISDDSVDQTQIQLQSLVQTHEITVKIDPDPEWQFYNEWLYPNEAEQQDMSNHSVVAQLHEHGDQLHIPRIIDHSAFFEDEAKASAFLEEIQKQGFDGSIEKDQQNNDISVCFSREDVAQLGPINDLVRGIIETLEEFDGDYDGWGSPIIRE